MGKKSEKQHAERIRIILADDHALVRAGFRVLLSAIEGVEVVGEAGEGYAVLRMIRETRPDVVLMDITMPGLNGLDVLARVVKELPGVHVIILSMHDNEEYVVQALNLGAAGYMLKTASTAELELAVRSAMKGETFLSPAISKQVVSDYVARIGGRGGGEADEKTEINPYQRLTPRQRQILQLIAEGHTTKKIAQELDLSIKTVEVHRMQLMERLNIHDVTGLVRYAIRSGIIS